MTKHQERTLYPLPTPVDDGSRICVKLYIPNIPGHREALIGAIYNLTKWYSWERDTAKTGKEVAAVWSGVFSQMLETFYDGCPEYQPCFSFPPSAPFIDWYPTNPFLPDQPTPPGYGQPPWFVSNGASSTLLGVQNGDVVTWLDRLIWPAPGFPESLPTFIVHVNGTVTVKLHLTNMYLGSLAQITVNSEIGSVRFVDLYADVAQLPPESAGEIIVEVPITVPGDNSIEVVIVPAINDEVLPPVRFGGGLRSIELCGLNAGRVDMPNPIFRFTAECGLEISYNGTDYDPVTGWSEFAEACFKGDAGEPGATGPAGPPGETGPQGPAGTPGTPGQDATGKLIRCRTVNAAVPMFFTERISPLINAIIGVTSTSGTISQAYDAAQLNWYPIPSSEADLQFYNVVEYLFNLDSPTVGVLANLLNAMSDPNVWEIVAQTWFCRLCEDGALTLPNANGFLTDMQPYYPDPVGNPAEEKYKQWAVLLWLAWHEFPLGFAPDVMKWYFAVQADDCADCSDYPECPEDGAWCIVADFSIEYYGWENNGASGNGAYYDSGIGWKTTTLFAAIQLPFIGADITRITVEGVGWKQVQIESGAVTDSQTDTPPTVFDVEITASAAPLTVSASNVDDPAGTVTITKITIEGTGTPPTLDWPTC